jgi:hypothetical protein
MKTQIIWKLMFRVNNRRAFDRCLGSCLPLFGSDCNVEDGKQYWKIHELWECSIRTLLLHDILAENLLSCLLTATRLATGWHVLGPLTAESIAGFSGVFDKKHGGRTWIPGLEWASFEVQ